MKHTAPFLLFLASGFLAVSWPLLRPDDATEAYALGLVISLAIYLAWVILVIRDKFYNNNGDDDDSTSDFYKYGTIARDNTARGTVDGDGGSVPAGVLPRTAGPAQGARCEATDIPPTDREGGDTEGGGLHTDTGTAGGGEAPQTERGETGRGDEELPPEGELKDIEVMNKFP